MHANCSYSIVFVMTISAHVAFNDFYFQNKDYETLIREGLTTKVFRVNWQTNETDACPIVLWIVYVHKLDLTD